MEENIFMQKENKTQVVEYYQPIHIAKKKNEEVHSGDTTKGVAGHPLDKKISKSVTHRWMQSIISAETLPACFEGDRERTKWRKAVIFLRFYRTGHRAIGCQQEKGTLTQWWFRDQQGCHCHSEPRGNRYWGKISFPSVWGVGVGTEEGPPQFQQVRLLPFRASGERPPSWAAGVTLLPSAGPKNRAVSQRWIFSSLKYNEVKRKSLSHIWLFATPWTIQTMEFTRPEYWSG